MSDTPKPKTKKPLSSARSYARVAAVQALYQMSQTGDDLNEVLAWFVASELDKIAPPQKADEKFFLKLVRGTVERQGEVDSLIAANLDKDWSLTRLDLVTLNILRAGLYELMAFHDVPTAVVLNEYIDIARAFHEGDEPRFINGLMDRVGKALREGESL